MSIATFDLNPDPICPERGSSPCTDCVFSSEGALVCPPTPQPSAPLLVAYQNTDFSKLSVGELVELTGVFAQSLIREKSPDARRMIVSCLNEIGSLPIELDDESASLHELIVRSLRHALKDENENVVSGAVTAVANDTSPYYGVVANRLADVAVSSLSLDVRCAALSGLMGVSDSLAIQRLEDRVVVLVESHGLNALPQLHRELDLLVEVLASAMDVDLKDRLAPFMCERLGDLLIAGRASQEEFLERAPAIDVCLRFFETEIPDGLTSRMQLAVAGVLAEIHKVCPLYEAPVAELSRLRDSVTSVGRMIAELEASDTLYGHWSRSSGDSETRHVYAAMLAMGSTFSDAAADGVKAILIDDRCESLQRTTVTFLAHKCTPFDVDLLELAALSPFESVRSIAEGALEGVESAEQDRSAYASEGDEFETGEPDVEAIERELIEVTEHLGPAYLSVLKVEDSDCEVADDGSATSDESSSQLEQFKLRIADTTSFEHDS